MNELVQNSPLRLQNPSVLAGRGRQPAADGRGAAILIRPLMERAAAIRRFSIRDMSLKQMAGLFLAVLAMATVAYAQIEGDNRGVQPINSSTDYEVTNIEIDVMGDNAEDARQKGWQEAQRKGWAALARKMGAVESLPDSTLNGIVTAIVVQEELVSEKRYIAKLGVLFDKVRSSPILGVSGGRMRSPPLLVIPVTYIGNSPQVFENRSDWQKAWAVFRTGDSSVDYVRTAGTGADTLLLQAGQIGRRNRAWWRVILDQYGAADVIMPIARIERSYPGGPVKGTFSARYGPDNILLGTFEMTAASAKDVPDMMAKAVVRIDEIYRNALAAGQLRPDTSLIFEDPNARAAEEREAEKAEDATEVDSSDSTDTGDTSATPETPATPATPDVQSISVTVQYDSPDAASVNSAESSVRGASGVQSANTSSVAIGGTSVMRVTYKGDMEGLKAALAARGWRVQEGGGALRISR